METVADGTGGVRVSVNDLNPAQRITLLGNCSLPQYVNVQGDCGVKRHRLVIKVVPLLELRELMSEEFT